MLTQGLQLSSKGNFESVRTQVSSPAQLIYKAAMVPQACHDLKNFEVGNGSEDGG